MEALERIKTYENLSGVRKPSKKKASCIWQAHFHVFVVAWVTKMFRDASLIGRATNTDVPLWLPVNNQIF